MAKMHFLDVGFRDAVEENDFGHIKQAVSLQLDHSKQEGKVTSIADIELRILLGKQLFICSHPSCFEF